MGERADASSGIDLSGRVRCAVEARRAMTEAALDDPRLRGTEERKRTAERDLAIADPGLAAPVRDRFATTLSTAQARARRDRASARSAAAGTGGGTRRRPDRRSDRPAYRNVVLDSWRDEDDANDRRRGGARDRRRPQRAAAATAFQTEAADVRDETEAERSPLSS